MSGDTTANISDNAFRGLGSGISVEVDAVGLTVEDNDHRAGRDGLQLPQPDHRRHLQRRRRDRHADRGPMRATTSSSILGGSGNDTLTGTAGGDLIDGNNGPANPGGHRQRRPERWAATTCCSAAPATTRSTAAPATTRSTAAPAPTPPSMPARRRHHRDRRGWTVTDAGGTDTLTGIEIVNDGAAGKTLLVGNGGFATIQAAVDAAADGDMILVAAGTYNEIVTVDKDVTITGRTWASPGPARAPPRRSSTRFYMHRGRSDARRPRGARRRHAARQSRRHLSSMPTTSPSPISSSRATARRRCRQS